MPMFDDPQSDQQTRERLERLGLNDPLGYVEGANVYEFVHDDPADRTDPTGLYDWAGHYYTTYITAWLAGMSPDQAAELAYWSEYPDLNPGIDAIGALSRHRLDQAERIQNLLHSLTNGDPKKRRCILSHLLQQPALKPWQRGLLIHALGDAYAHTFDFFGEHGFAPPFGHLLGGHAPDYIGNAPGKWQSFVGNLYGLLGGAPNNARLGSFLASAPNRPALTFLDDFWLRDAEINTLRGWAAQHGLNIPDKDHIQSFGDLSDDDITSLMQMIEQAAKSGCCK